MNSNLNENNKNSDGDDDDDVNGVKNALENLIFTLYGSSEKFDENDIVHLAEILLKDNSCTITSKVTNLTETLAKTEMIRLQYNSKKQKNKKSEPRFKNKISINLYNLMRESFARIPRWVSTMNEFCKKIEKEKGRYEKLCTIRNDYLTYFWDELLEDFSFNNSERWNPFCDMSSRIVSLLLSDFSKDQIVSQMRKAFSNVRTFKIPKTMCAFDYQLKKSDDTKKPADVMLGLGGMRLKIPYVFYDIERVIKHSIFEAHSQNSIRVSNYPNIFGYDSFFEYEASIEDDDADVVLEMMLYYYIIFKSEFATYALYDNQNISPESSLVLFYELYGADNESRMTGFFEWWRLVLYGRSKSDATHKNTDDKKTHLDSENDTIYSPCILPPTFSLDDMKNDYLSLLSKLVRSDKEFSKMSASSLYVCEKMDDHIKGLDRIYDYFTFRRIRASNDSSTPIMYNDECSLSEIERVLDYSRYCFEDISLPEIKKRKNKDRKKNGKQKQPDTSVVHTDASFHTFESLSVRNLPDFMNRRYESTTGIEHNVNHISANLVSFIPENDTVEGYDEDYEIWKMNKSLRMCHIISDTLKHFSIQSAVYKCTGKSEKDFKTPTNNDAKFHPETIFRECKKLSELKRSVLEDTLVSSMSHFRKSLMEKDEKLKKDRKRGAKNAVRSSISWLTRNLNKYSSTNTSCTECGGFNTKPFFSLISYITKMAYDTKREITTDPNCFDFTKVESLITVVKEFNSKYMVDLEYLNQQERVMVWDHFQLETACIFEKNPPIFNERLYKDDAWIHGRLVDIVTAFDSACDTCIEDNRSNRISSKKKKRTGDKNVRRRDKRQKTSK